MDHIQPLVTVIIPTKNAAAHLARALHSVVNQGYQPLEILVVDGHSTDETVEIARSFPNVQVIVQTGTGLSDGWNCGIRRAQGELIAFLDSDDTWTPGRLATQTGYMLAHPEVDYTVVETHHVHGPGQPLPPQLRRTGMEVNVSALIPGATMMWRSLFDRVGLFDPGLMICGDIDWFFRAKDLGARLVELPAVGLVKQTRAESLSMATDNGPSYRRELIEVIRRSVARQKRGKEPNLAAC